MYYFKLYFKIIGKSIESQLEYPLSFLLHFTSSFLLYLAKFSTIYILLSRFKSIAGWSFGEICIFYGLINISYAISDIITQGFWNISNMIKSGEFDRFLLKPCPVLIQVLGFNFSIDRIGRLVQAVVVLIIGFIQAEITLTFYKLALLIWTIVGGSSLFMSILIIQAALTFKTTEAVDILYLLTNGGVETAQYPMSIYNTTFRHIFTYIIPLGCVNYFSILPILSKTDVLGTTVIFQCATPLSGVIFLLISLFIWKKGLKWYASTGT